MGQQSSEQANPRRWMVLIACVVAALAIVGLVVRVLVTEDPAVSDGGGSTQGGASASPSSGGTPSASNAPSESASPGPDETTPSPTRTPASETMNPRTERAELGQTAEPLAGVQLSVEEVEPIRVRARAPGEVSGPALRVTLRVANDSDDAVEVNTTVANLYYGTDRTPASPITLSGSRPFPASIGGSEEASGIFVFSVPRDDRERLLLEIILGSQLRTVEFTGGCPADC